MWLEGDELRGGYALTRTAVRGDPEDWLLVKVDDETADARRNPVSTEPESVISGRTVDEIERRSRVRRIPLRWAAHTRFMSARTRSSGTHPKGWPPPTGGPSTPRHRMASSTSP